MNTPPPLPAATSFVTVLARISLVLAALGWALGLSGLPLAVMIVAASLPVGANVFLFAQRYAVAEDEVTASVAVSTALALVTMPVAIVLVTRFVV